MNKMLLDGETRRDTSRERGRDRGKEDKISQRKAGNQLFNVTSVVYSNCQHCGEDNATHNQYTS